MTTPNDDLDRMNSRQLKAQLIQTTDELETAMRILVMGAGIERLRPLVESQLRGWQESEARPDYQAGIGHGRGWAAHDASLDDLHELEGLRFGGGDSQVDNLPDMADAIDHSLKVADLGGQADRRHFARGFVVGAYEAWESIKAHISGAAD